MIQVSPMGRVKQAIPDLPGQHPGATFAGPDLDSWNQSACPAVIALNCLIVPITLREAEVHGPRPGAADAEVGTSRR